MNILEARRRTLGKGVYKKTVEGNPAIAQGSLARRYPGITMQGWTEQNGTPTPETPVPIVSAGTQNQDAGKWEYEITIANAQTDPDKNQTVTLTADRPLTKWDRLEKRGGQWGWVYKSNTVTLDGSEVWQVYGSGFHTPRALLETYTRTHGVCEQGDVKAYDSTDGVYGQNSIWLGVSNSDIYWNENPYFNVELEDSGIENWKNHLSQNPAVIWYETAAETFVPLTASEQEAMNALHTFRPTTVLSNDCKCEMTLTYKTKKSLGVTT